MIEIMNRNCPQALAALLVLGGMSADGSEKMTAHFRMEAEKPGALVDDLRKNNGKYRGKFETAPGAVGNSVIFDGAGAYAIVEEPEAMSLSENGFTVSLWVNPYSLHYDEQMLVGKNNYAANQREWGLLIGKNNRFQAAVRDGGKWNFVTAPTPPQPGDWQHLAMTVSGTTVSLYLDGQLAGEKTLTALPAPTDVPFTLGGILSGSSVTQSFSGALDDVRIFSGALGADEIAEIADIAPPAPHSVPPPSITSLEKIPGTEAVALWSLPSMEKMKRLEGVTFHAIKNYEPEVDGFRWLHGVGLVWHRDRLYASFGHNKGHENTRGEMARYRISDDGGKTWGEVRTIAASEGDLSVSSGVFHSTGEELWAFHGSFHDDFQRTHCRAFRLNESTGEWLPMGVVVDKGFWPLQQPVKMEDGNYVMAGARVAKGYPDAEMPGGPLHLPAVAISRGDDLTKWDLVVVPLLSGLTPPWGESNVIVDGSDLTLISRWNRMTSPVALVSESRDFGRTWTELRPSTLQMAASKPSAGMLSNGQRFVISNSAADNGNNRIPLTITYSAPGERALSNIRMIRNLEEPKAPANGRLSYPFAIEHEGNLYVGYSNTGGRRGNQNNAELAVIPLESLNK